MKPYGTSESLRITEPPSPLDIFLLTAHLRNTDFDITSPIRSYGSWPPIPHTLPRFGVVMRRKEECLTKEEALW
jgi:hypothetical protein